jgi:hypothetical protein
VAWEKSTPRVSSAVRALVEGLAFGGLHLEHRGREVEVKRSGFDKAIAAARALPGVEVTTAWGASALKVRGKMFACVAINKSAEPNSMVVRMDMAQRDLLIEEDPATYYLTDHYVGYPCVLVRLSRVSPDALRDLIRGAHRIVSATTPSARRSSSPGGRKASTMSTKKRR